MRVQGCKISVFQIKQYVINYKLTVEIKDVHYSYQEVNRKLQKIKRKWVENKCHTNSKQKQAGIALILDKTDSKTNLSYINKDRKKNTSSC